MQTDAERRATVLAVIRAKGGKDVPIDQVVKACNAAAYLFNRVAPLFNLTPRDEQKLTDYFLDTLSGVFDRIPEER